MSDQSRTPANPLPSVPDDLAEHGKVTWHSSEEDGAPDVGISIGLGSGKHLWLGEIANSRHAEAGDAVAALGGPSGWWLILYDDNAPRGEQSTVLGKLSDDADYSAFADTLAGSMRLVPAPSPARVIGVTEEDREIENRWRRLALLFDRHRIEAMMLLRLVAGGHAGTAEVSEFIAQPPPPSPSANEALLAEVEGLRAAPEAAYQTRTSPEAGGGGTFDEGIDFALERLCTFLGVDKHSVRWDAATETVEGDVSSVIGNILRAHFGEDWGPEAALASPPAVEWRARETFASIQKWCEETFGPITPERMVERAGEEFDELRADPTSAEEAADVVICLSRVPNLWEAIERKMAKNRARTWNVRGDGTGYHVKPPAPAVEGK